jgi:hypothetical protein
MGKYPLPTLTVLIIVIAMTALTAYIQQCNWFVMLGYFSITAVLSNRMVGAMIRRELGDEPGDTEEEDPGFNIEVDED